MMKRFICNGLVSVVVLILFPSFLSQELVYTKVLSNKVLIKLPSDFKIMDPQTLSSKYSRNKIKPTEVYTNRDATVNITFNLMSQVLTEDNVIKYGNSSIKQIASLNEVRDVKGSNEIINGKEIVVVEFFSKAIDGDIYNLMFIASVDGRLMLGSFNCIAAVLPQWQHAAHEIVNSLKVN
jgi:hypothetical protein